MEVIVGNIMNEHADGSVEMATVVLVHHPILVEDVGEAVSFGSIGVDPSNKDFYLLWCFQLQLTNVSCREIYQ